MLRSSCPAMVLAAVLLAPAAHAAGSTLDTASIESIIGLSGSYDEAENVFRVSRPRTDLQPNANRWTLPPFMGVTCHAAFMPTAAGTMLMGDTVLREDEVSPVMSAALDAGLEVTALHNHFFFDQPKVYLMHFAGIGETARLAAAVKAMDDRIGQVRAAQARPGSAFPGDRPTPSRISAAPIEAALGAKAQSSDGMVKVVIGRVAWTHGVEIGSGMGISTWAAFAGSDQRAVVSGDFAVLEGELQAVLKILRAEGIHIVAIHRHMAGEIPHYVFLHYWGTGKAVDLARAVSKALSTRQPTKYD